MPRCESTSDKRVAAAFAGVIRLCASGASTFARALHSYTVGAASFRIRLRLDVEQESLRRLFRQATVAVARHSLTTGDAGPMIEPLAQLVSVDPYYEEGHCLARCLRFSQSKDQP